MPALKNTRHERVAQELAKGKTAVEAYALAGYRPNRSHASRLVAKGIIRSRVAELQERGAKRVEVTTESIAAELEEARVLALAEKQASAAVSASLGKAKLYGLIIEKKHHSGRIEHLDLSKLSDDDLARLTEALGPIAAAGGDAEGDTPGADETRH